jgi:hypothetical protein
LRMQSLGDGLAQTTRGPGHQCRFTRQIKHIFCPL